MKLALMILAIVASPAAAAQPLAIAGVHLRDTPAEAMAAVEAEGYQVRQVVTSQTYSQRLQTERARRLRVGLPKITPTGIGSFAAIQGDQKLTVIFDDDESRRRVVSSISYIGRDVAHPYPEVLKKLIERYGPPTNTRPQSAAWCNEAKEGCNAGGISSSDMLSVRAEGGFSGNITNIELQIGERSEKAWKFSFLSDLRKIARAKDAF